jgi:hypothetical protein
LNTAASISSSVEGRTSFYVNGKFLSTFEYIQQQ